MINKLYLFFLTLFIDLFDNYNKKKIIIFFKKKFKKKKILVFDIGSHKGETFYLFSKNFNLKKIFCFEPNPLMFEKLRILKEKINYGNNAILLNYGVADKEGSEKLTVFNDTSSSTMNKINSNTNYYKRKKKIITLFANKFIKKKIKVKIVTLNKIFKKYKLNKLDLLKIDTEGFEYKILSSLNKNFFKKISYIYFEHHYDLMIMKNYKFDDINKLLLKNKFKLSAKFKMPFRKTFEYIYEKKK